MKTWLNKFPRTVVVLAAALVSSNGAQVAAPVVIQRGPHHDGVIAGSAGPGAARLRQRGNEYMRYGILGMDVADKRADLRPARMAGSEEGFPPELIGHWAARIRTTWSLGTNGVLELAGMVKEAHEALRPYRAWSWLCNSEKLPFKKSKAKYLLFIGKRLVGTVDGQTFGHLPHEVTVLYELAHLEPGEIKRCVDELLIRPDMNRAEAKALVAQLRGRQVSPIRKRKRRDLLTRLDRVTKSLEEDGRDWPKEVLRAGEVKAKGVVNLIQLRLKRLESKAREDQPSRGRFGPAGARPPIRISPEPDSKL